jgi:flagellin-like protein
MKANRSSITKNDDAVSPVIAVILMVAITVVLAATVYLWVSGFGSNQSTLVQASFGAKAVDLPGSATDTDSSDDAIQITFVSGSDDYQASDIGISIDGVMLTGAATGNFYPGGVFAANSWCTNSAGGDNDGIWERGASLYLVQVDAGTVAARCNDHTPITSMQNIDGVHQITISVKGQVVLDSTVEVHDDVQG